MGDGTTSVVILAAELLRRANELVRHKIHPTNIIAGYRLAMREVSAPLLLSAWAHPAYLSGVHQRRRGVRQRTPQPSLHASLARVASPERSPALTCCRPANSSMN